jgi:hypothetical protein
MISWAEVESRARRPQRENQLREYAQMELGSTNLSHLLVQIFGGVGGNGRPRRRRRELKNDSSMSEIHIETPKPDVIR